MTTGIARDLESGFHLMEASYKGWLIRYCRRVEWTAQLFQPGCIEPTPDEVVASVEEGEIILIQRAQRKIDSQVLENRS
jgi:hypothetical protein